jgi:[protein-PII] uridylyltransferase
VLSHVPEVNLSEQSEFVESMPRGYRYVFSPRGIADHARLSRERDGGTARVGRFHSRRDLGAAAICVVAADRPGLLATISAALVAHQLDVVHAEAYTRHVNEGAYEAVDVFWVRDLQSTNVEQVTDERLAALEHTLVDLIEGRRDLTELTGIARRTDRAYEANVRFIEDDDGQLTTLEVETVDRSGLLLALAQALFEQRVQITRSEVRTEGDRVHDRFVLLELDGSQIQPARRLDIQVAILAAIDPWTES